MQLGFVGAGSKPALTRLADSLHSESKPNHQLKIKPLSDIVRQLKTFFAKRINKQQSLKI